MTFSMTQYKAVSNWLFFCAFMVFAMAVIGAVTRLTESGLSITEWKPITGTLPPLNEAEWEHQFALYKNSPEFAAKHFWMDLSDFKKIFFWEWLHRLWGRSIGLVYVVPLVWFAVRRELPKGWGWKFTALLALGGLQGFIGWFMVQSGLIDRPSVSHFRLALHLGMALLLFAVLIWFALDLRKTTHPANPVPRFAAWGWGVLALVSTTILWGAFVAGLDAGMIYNEFPKMGAGFVPSDFGDPLTSAAGVQFVHRWLAVVTLFAVLGYAWLMRGSSKLVLALALMVVVQVGLGLGTLLTQVNLHLAASHQAGAAILLGLLVALLQGYHAQKRRD
jgi:cytochrome c oxidase assembly protein subunit 15